MGIIEDVSTGVAAISVTDNGKYFIESSVLKSKNLVKIIKTQHIWLDQL